METELEKLDLLRQRFNLSYKDAKEALDLAGGDVVQALIQLEDHNKTAGWSEKFEGKGKQMAGQLRAVWNKSKKTKIRLKKGDKTIVEIPASVGALGILGVLASTELAIIGFLGAATAMAKKYSLEVDKKQEQTDLQWEEDTPEEAMH